MTAQVLPDSGIDVTLPPGSEPAEPPERRGLARDGVRLLVASPDRVRTTVFRELATALAPGDLLVVNTSATLPAAVAGLRAGQPPTSVHVASQLDDGAWVVEVRRPDNTGPQRDLDVGEVLELAGGQRLRVDAAYPDEAEMCARLWRGTPDPARDRVEYLLDHGRPIRYPHVAAGIGLADLQNVYADVSGSAEMASAGRPLTRRVLVSLLTRGVAVAPIVLHTGVSSQERGEPPMPERYAVPAATARLVNMTAEAGGRVIAVGTTSTRALETVADERGRVTAGEGWTDLVLGPDRPARVVRGVISGLHEPEASHLLLLESVAGIGLVRAAYREAVSRGYHWHEFGDSMLFLPRLDRG